MSGQFIGYPTGWILGVLDDPAEAAQVEADLEAAGIGLDDRMNLTGDEGARRLDGLGKQSGFLARMHRVTQFLAMDQMPDFLVYELALHEGRTVVGVRPKDTERSAAIDVLKRHGAHFINRFGAWSTEEVLPWRGTMPEIPQLMQR